MKKASFAYSMLLLSLGTSAQINYVVAKDGSGDFTSVQAAFDKIPKNNRQQAVIMIREGVYKEKLHLDSTKDNVMLIAQNKFNVVLTYDDHTGKKAPSGEVISTRTSWSFIVYGNNFEAHNITFQNSSGPNAGQAVAVEVRGDKVRFENCRFVGDQDVLYTSAENSRQYYVNCYIEGTTDFIFGAATAWFDRCHIHSKKNSHITAASTPQSHAFGYVFNECIFTADTAFTKVTLGRPWRPYASVAYIHCYLDRHIVPEGWDNWRNPENEKTARYFEYKNYGPGADIKNRVPWSKQLTDAAAGEYTIMNVFRGWNPEDGR